MADDVETLFGRLALALHDANPSLVVQPLEIAELSARWIPYAKVRGELGIPTNEDYELLLMRLVSGEGGFVFADESLQDDLRRELDSTNPDLTALRTYGSARISLAREAVRRALDLDPAALPQPPVAVAKAAARPRAPEVSPVGDPTAPSPLPRTTPHSLCQFCGKNLPSGRAAAYCPHCGLNVTTQLCPGCSSEVAPGWRFCVTCGRAIGGRSP
jgi:hypothetical protein